MEYKLNKIDLELRARIEDKVKDGKIHSKEEIKIYKDSEKNKKREFYKKEKTNEKKKVLVDGVKLSSKNIKVNGTKKKMKEESLKGTIIDVKK